MTMYYHPITRTACICVILPPLPLLSVLIICLHTAVHNPAGGPVKHNTISIQPCHRAVFPDIAPHLHVIFLTPQTHL